MECFIWALVKDLSNEMHCHLVVCINLEHHHCFDFGKGVEYLETELCTSVAQVVDGTSCVRSVVPSFCKS
ncbi:hypothetical protein Mapa_009992 [Marchantia paleacea]|nr:hypothetical protein Mapa_009992 [Marchantia paleacea]